jgi:hypothetical protein
VISRSALLVAPADVCCYLPASAVLLLLGTLRYRVRRSSDGVGVTSLSLRRLWLTVAIVVAALGSGDAATSATPRLRTGRPHALPIRIDTGAPGTKEGIPYADGPVMPSVNAPTFADRPAPIIPIP